MIEFRCASRIASVSDIGVAVVSIVCAAAPLAKMQRDAVTEFNRMYFLAARDFYRPSGFPNSRLERNLWSGSDGILPGIAGAIERKEEPKLVEEASLYLNAIKQRVASLRALQARLSAL